MHLSLNMAQQLVIQIFTLYSYSESRLLCEFSEYRLCQKRKQITRNKKRLFQIHMSNAAKRADNIYIYKGRNLEEDEEKRKNREEENNTTKTYKKLN